MIDPVSRQELIQKVLLHLYNSAVVGSLSSTAPVLHMKDTSSVRNPRFKDLQALYKLTENDRKLFYEAAVAVVCRVLYFVETYNRFDSEKNKESYPQVSLVYTTSESDDLHSLPLSEFGSEALADEFLRIAKSPEMRAHMELVIERFAGNKPKAEKKALGQEKEEENGTP